MDIKKILPKNGPPIEEVSKYIEKYKDDLICLKYGGNIFLNPEIFKNFIEDLSILNKLGLSIIIVHGGGPRIQKELEKSNIQLKYLYHSKLCNKSTKIYSSHFHHHCTSLICTTNYIAEYT